eukprot:gene6407-6638_t
MSDKGVAAECLREIELGGGRCLQVAEHHILDNESGSVVWDCGLVLAHFLIKQSQSGNIKLAGKRVIELGSGTGVVGLTAAALGAQQVLLTDRTQLVPQLLDNIQRNHLQHVASAAALDWGQPLPPAAQPAYDLLLCSDLVYSESSVGLLLSSIAALTAPGSVIYASCEYREGGGLELLHQFMPEYGLQAQLVPFTLLDEAWRSPDILVWQIMATAAGRDQQHQQQQQLPVAVHDRKHLQLETAAPSADQLQAEQETQSQCG